MYQRFVSIESQKDKKGAKECLENFSFGVYNLQQDLKSEKAQSQGFLLFRFYSSKFNI